MKIVVGDLLKLANDGQFDVIVHGCNCFHLMGAGIAGQIADRYPEALQADKDDTKYGDVTKLGTYSYVYVGSMLSGHMVQVVNMYTQYKPGRCAKEVLYPSIRAGFSLLDDKCVSGSRVGIPMIGCGIAGGDWDEVCSIIKEAAPNLDITLVMWG